MRTWAGSLPKLSLCLVMTGCQALVGSYEVGGDAGSDALVVMFPSSGIPTSLQGVIWAAVECDGLQYPTFNFGENLVMELAYDENHCDFQADYSVDGGFIASATTLTFPVVQPTCASCPACPTAVGGATYSYVVSDGGLLQVTYDGGTCTFTSSPIP